MMDAFQIYWVTIEALVAETALWPIPCLIDMLTSHKGSLFCFHFQDCDTAFPIRYRFGARRLQAKTKVQTDVLDELLYTGDLNKNASSDAKRNARSNGSSFTII